MVHTPTLTVTTLSGGAYNATTGELALTVAGGPLTVTIGKLGDANGLTQLSDSFAPTSITKDGSPVGNLTAVEVDENGLEPVIPGTLPRTGLDIAGLVLAAGLLIVTGAGLRRWSKKLS